MTIIFDSQTIVYTECIVCEQLMQVINMGDHSHPCCDPDVTNPFWEPPPLMGAALQYAAWMWPVFPLGARSKKPAIPKEQGGHGFQDATTDRGGVRSWWNRNPRYNIGIATGHRFDVIDVDPKAGGNESLTELLAAHRIPTVHAVARTGSGGLHLYIKLRRARNGAAILPGVDYRGLGGYVAVSPSTRGPGQTYTWLVVPSPTIKGRK